MKDWGIGLIVAGVLGLVITLSMDTSLSTGIYSSDRFYNVGLMQRQHNWLMIACLVVVVGVVLLVAGNQTGAKSKFVEHAVIAKAKAAKAFGQKSTRMVISDEVGEHAEINKVKVLVLDGKIICPQCSASNWTDAKKCTKCKIEFDRA